MKLSKYNYLFEHKGSHYLYNILSTAIVKLDDVSFNRIKVGNILSFSSDEIELLSKNHMVVDDGINEFEEYLYYYDSVRLGRSAKTLSLTFIPTYNCNLACPYCIQGGVKPVYKIKEKQIDLIIKFAERQIKSHDTKVIYCLLFGGEPMMAKVELCYFAEQMKMLAQKNNCEIHYSMTSNFTLLDDSMIDLIRKYNMTVQVSIDGTKTDHDNRRISHRGEGTYDIIMSNLRRMNEEGLKDRLNVRLNVDVNNIGTAKEMLSSVRNYSDNIYFGVLSHNNEKNDCYEQNCVDKSDYAYTNVKLLDSFLRESGLPTPRHFGKELSCSINSEQKFMIDYKLNVYKCELFIGREEASVGRIDDEGNFIPNGNFYHQMCHTPAKFKECRDCKFLPLCAGGCMAKSNIRKGVDIQKLTEKNCMFTEADLDVYLKDYIDNNM